MAEPKPEVASFSSFLSPVNAALIAVAVYILYARFSRPASAPVAHAAEAIVFQDYTPRQLAKFNGVDDDRVYLAVSGSVYDVSAGKTFYGPNGPYRNFGGRDASRGLAKGSFDEDVLSPLDQIDDLKDLEAEERESLRDWESHFATKYIHIGRLVPNE